MSDIREKWKNAAPEQKERFIKAIDWILSDNWLYEMLVDTPEYVTDILVRHGYGHHNAMTDDEKVSALNAINDWDSV